MITVQQIVYQFLTHEGVNQAWVASRLYTGKPSTARSKLHAKLYGTDGRSFTDAELERLMAIRKEFIASIV